MGVKVMKSLKIRNLQIVAMGFAAAGLLFLSGCGKNPTGPVTSQAAAGQSLSNTAGAASDSSGDEGSVSAACHGRQGYRGWWSNARYYAFLMKLTPQLIQHFYSTVIPGTFADPEARNRITDILRSRIFHIVFFNCGVGYELFRTWLRIVAHSWAPGNNTNPNDFTPEITLLPYKYKPCRGFYGDFLDGWGNGNGYHLEAVNPLTDRCEVQTFTYPGNLFHNELNISELNWCYYYVPKEYVPDEGRIPCSARFRFNFDAANHRLVFNPLSNYLNEDGTIIQVTQGWASTQDKSGLCRIFSTDSRLVLYLEFNPAGEGQGSLNLRNAKGETDVYEFTVFANGHGFYTKNGRRHCF